MPLSAWLMLVFGCSVLYGGLALCITIAVRGRNCRKRSAPSPDTAPSER